MKPKLTLVHHNKNLKTYYIPFTTMNVDYFSVKATSPEQAIMKANDGKFDRVEKRISLIETRSNMVHESLDVNANEALVRNVECYDLKESTYDDIIKNL